MGQASARGVPLLHVVWNGLNDMSPGTAGDWLEQKAPSHTAVQRDDWLFSILLFMQPDREKYILSMYVFLCVCNEGTLRSLYQSLLCFYRKHWKQTSQERGELHSGSGSAGTRPRPHGTGSCEGRRLHRIRAGVLASTSTLCNLCDLPSLLYSYISPLPNGFPQPHL